MSDDLMTVVDSFGASIVFERDLDAGVIAVWIAPPGENDGPSVLLGEGSIERVAAFLLKGRP